MATKQNTGYTPGPWVWRCDPGENCALHSAHGTVIDHTNGEGMWFARYNAPEDSANARLIAAAPELVEVLRWYVTGEGTPDFDGERGRAVLAKVQS